MRLRPTCLALADVLIAFGRGPSAEGLGTGGGGGGPKESSGERDEPTLKVRPREKHEGEEGRCQKGIQEKFSQNVFVGPQKIFSKSSTCRQCAVKLDSFCRFIQVLSPALSGCETAGRELSYPDHTHSRGVGRGWSLGWADPGSNSEPWLHRLPLQRASSAHKTSVFLSLKETESRLTRLSPTCHPSARHGPGLVVG